MLLSLLPKIRFKHRNPRFRSFNAQLLHNNLLIHYQYLPIYVGKHVTQLGRQACASISHHYNKCFVQCLNQLSKKLIIIIRVLEKSMKFIISRVLYLIFSILILLNIKLCLFNVACSLFCYCRLFNSFIINILFLTVYAYFNRPFYLSYV